MLTRPNEFHYIVVASGVEIRDSNNVVWDKKKSVQEARDWIREKKEAQTK